MADAKASTKKEKKEKVRAPVPAVQSFGKKKVRPTVPPPLIISFQSDPFTSLHRPQWPSHESEGTAEA